MLVPTEALSWWLRARPREGGSLHLPACYPTIVISNARPAWCPAGAPPWLGHGRQGTGLRSGRSARTQSRANAKPGLTLKLPPPTPFALPILSFPTALPLFVPVLKLPAAYVARPQSLSLYNLASKVSDSRHVKQIPADKISAIPTHTGHRCLLLISHGHRPTSPASSGM